MAIILNYMQSRTESPCANPAHTGCEYLWFISLFVHVAYRKVFLLLFLPFYLSTILFLYTSPLTLTLRSDPVPWWSTRAAVCYLVV